MKHKSKLLLSVGLIGVVLSGCSDEMAPGENDSKKNTEDFNYATYYDMDNKDVLVEIGDNKLTVGEVKKSSFEQLLISQINQFIEKQIVLEKFPVSDEDLNKAMAKYPEGIKIDKETVRYQLAVDKAVRKDLTITEEDLKKIYTEKFSDTGVTFEEAKSEIENMAPYYMGVQLSDVLNEYKNNIDITYNDKALKTYYNSLFLKENNNGSSSDNKTVNAD